ncbi:conjugal transfer protein TraF [Alteromonas sp. ASW11-130]|uniref:conjugal transfer protein TraF n=1 Tax=Alteromonas sp. ASW11-130 TaxID=3015775 RepID=UPI0022418F4F|nr:conjugal transfer protein TraF [Alteromonas sp. ASW11-130]MCW8090787.1 conjugal transfer protein TraF [Alteromonas sp. ASW11-130]
MRTPTKLTLVIATLFSTYTLADQPIYHPIGPSLTQGKISSKYDLTSVMNNPAASPLVFDKTKDENWRIGAIGPFGIGYEVGQVDDLVDELDELIDILDSENLSADDALDAVDRFEPFLVNAEKDGYVKASTAFTIPLLPVVYNHPTLGTFTFEVSSHGQLKGNVLADDIEIIVLDGGYELNTNASMYVKSAVQLNASLGYAKAFWERDYGQLIGGLRAKLVTMELSKSVLSFSALDSSDDLADVIEDEYDKGADRTSALALDLGLLWVADNYSFGITVTDINEPEFEYGDLISNCANETGVGIDNCYAAQQFITAGRINGQETHVANSQVTLEGSVLFGGDKQFGLHASVDLNDKNDPVGDLYQWSTIAMTYNFDNWVLPQLRAGYSYNSAGSELGYYNVGITVLNNLYMDVRWSDENTAIDDSSGPRSAFINIGFQTRF